MFQALPEQMRFIERGWLNSNQILFLSGAANVLVDTGYGTHVERTLTLLREPGALGSRPLHRIINTHCHSDHMGGNARLAREYGCRIAVPVAEADGVRAWDQPAMWLDWTDQECERFPVDDAVSPGEILPLGDLQWVAIAAPGHDMGALMFYCEAHKLLITGDALWENGLGVIPPGEGSVARTQSALDTLGVIEQLQPRSILPGHGRAFDDIEGAIYRARTRLRAMADDPVKHAGHVAKVMLMFALLNRGQMTFAELPPYLERVPCYGLLRQYFPQRNANDLAEWLISELKRAMAVTVRDGVVRPTVAA